MARTLEPQQIPVYRPVIPSETRTYIANECAVFAEYADLCAHPCDGVFVVPSDTQPNTWQGTLTIIDHGPYDGAVFRFTLSFSPAIGIPEIPRFIFGSHVFHPLVDARSGEFDLGVHFPQWSNKIRMRQVLEAVRNAFAVIDVSGQRNPEASALYRASPSDYRTRVTIDIITTMENLADENAPLSSIQMNFGPWIDALHEPILREILATGAVIMEKNGLPPNSERS